MSTTKTQQTIEKIPDSPNHRGIQPDVEIHEHETDLELLSKWLKLAGRAESIENFIEKM